MDLIIEANRNSALFTTMQEVLDVVNPLLSKSRPTVVNEAKHRYNIKPNGWGNTLQQWSQQRTVRFDIPRVASMYDASIKAAIQFPGVAPTATQRRQWGNRGYAKPTLTTGGLNNSRGTTDTAGGRLDRIYADRLLGFNMIREYTLLSKGRRLFTADSRYMMIRFNQLSDEAKQSFMKATTPVDIHHPDKEQTFYSPGLTYQIRIPLWFFFNEHISYALDVNFCEEVYIELQLRAPSELFFYGNLGNYLEGDLALAAFNMSPPVPGFASQFFSYTTAELWTDITVSTLTAANANSTPVTWDYSYPVHGGGAGVGDNDYAAYPTLVSPGGMAHAFQQVTATTATALGADDIDLLTTVQMDHIRGMSAPYYQWGDRYSEGIANLVSGTTFRFPDIDNNGDSINVMFEGVIDYLVQDTDAARQLRKQEFPPETGLTNIVFNTSVETYGDLMASNSSSNNLLSVRSGGEFVDPDESGSGITMGDSTRSVRLELRTNNLVSQTHFMVRKESDFGGSGTANAMNKSNLNYGTFNLDKQIGASRFYTRCLPIHYFTIKSAGVIIYQSDADTHGLITQAKLMKGYSTSSVPGVQQNSRQNSALNGIADGGTMPMNIYTIPWGLVISRLESSGALSFQNLNNPVLEIYFKPDNWAEHLSKQDSNGHSEAKHAAAMGVRVDVVHEFFQVNTINSGNGEITTGLNQ